MAKIFAELTNAYPLSIFENSPIYKLSINFVTTNFSLRGLLIVWIVCLGSQSTKPVFVDTLLIIANFSLSDLHVLLILHDLLCTEVRDEWRLFILSEVNRSPRRSLRLTRGSNQRSLNY